MQQPYIDCYALTLSGWMTVTHFRSITVTKYSLDTNIVIDLTIMIKESITRKPSKVDTNPSNTPKNTTS